jgi:hypothetical protein
MNFWKLIILMMIIGCVIKKEREISIYNSAFTLILPPEVKDSKGLRTIYGDEVQFWRTFNNEDSTIKVDIQISKDTSRVSDDLIPYQIDLLQHLDPSMVVLNKGMIKQWGVEMLSIKYEIPLIQKFPGYIVERRMFLTMKGRGEVNVICRFDNLIEKEKCINLVNEISKSIKVGQ